MGGSRLGEVGDGGFFWWLGGWVDGWVGGRGGREVVIDMYLPLGFRVCFSRGCGYWFLCRNV